MTKFKKYRLVLACANVLGGALRLIAALVNMAFNYFCNAPEMDSPVRA
jgi:hypothetical protein